MTCSILEQNYLELELTPLRHMGAGHALRVALLGALLGAVSGAEALAEHAEAPACSELSTLLNVSHTKPRGADAGAARRPVRVHWGAGGGGAGRAGAALLRAAIHRGLARHAQLHTSPLTLCQLAAYAKTNNHEWHVAASVGWAGEPCGPDATVRPLAIVAAAPASLALQPRLYAAHAHRFPLNQQLVWIPTVADEQVPGLECRGVRAQRIPRRELEARLRQDNHSLLFLASREWDGLPGVEPALLCGESAACAADLPAIHSLRVVNKEIFTIDQPLANTVAEFSPEAAHLREILALHSSNMTLDEAVCTWAKADRHIDTFRSWIRPPTWTLSVRILHCAGDPDSESYVRLAQIVSREMQNDKEWNKAQWIVEYIHVKDVNCSDPVEVSHLILAWYNEPAWFNLLGVVGRGDGALLAARVARKLGLPLLLYEAAPRGLRRPLWAAAGGVADLARATRHLLDDCGWARLAVLSEPTRFATDFVLELTLQSGLVVRDVPVPLHSPAELVKATLSALRDANARILLVNTGAESAATVLSVAHSLSMTPAHGYVWIVREWRCTVAAQMIFYSVSLWRCEEAEAGGEALGARVTRAARAQWPRMWPLLAAPLADALLTLVFGFRTLLARYPDYAYNLHGVNVISEFSDSLVNSSIEGIGGAVLRYADSRLEEPLVHVTQWSGEGSSRLATWRVHCNGTVTHVKVTGQYPPPLASIPDGTAPCSLPVGDRFLGRCLTPWLVGAGALGALAAGALGGAWCSLRRWLARRDHYTWLSLLTRHEAATAALAAFLVEREALELREDLGSGSFGRVRLAMWHSAGTARAVAVKALRDGAAPAEERELLREASMLASLQHEHVVRLLGVCAADGPPLLLMEHAFFGDLLHYLCARRHLAEEGPGPEEAPGAQAGEAEAEAAHVSPESLTRLAREAASALGYLAHRGVVHRDVRAANCLVDARRRLQLADFGMARELPAAADGLAEYACRRRALLPVLWMAPESLARGVFSPASDVWALGVLVFELVTLGARPFGSWSPLHVLHHVTAGGRPDLPHDASPQTRGVALSCWQREAARRCSAAELVAYLAAHPRALRPALLPTAAPTLAACDHIPMTRLHSE